MAKKKQGTQKTQQSLANDAAKALLANIRFMSIDNPIKTISITSSIPNEGKSFVSVSLAQAIASSGKSCLIMEGDLRKRSLATAMGIHPKHGLHSVLSGEVPFNKAAVSTPQRNLYFLDAEPQIPNPSDLFGSKRFSDFMDSVSKQFDYVVVDTPPVGTFVDAAVVACTVDATFMVIRENFTKREFVLNSYEQLQQAGAHVAGVVMNDCDTSANGYYGYYGYYSYYSEDDKSTDANSATNTAFAAKGNVPAHSKQPGKPRQGTHGGQALQPSDDSAPRSVVSATSGYPSAASRGGKKGGHSSNSGPKN